jgi:hypothetical protein
MALLTKVTKTGHDGAATEALPPVEFGYQVRARRRFVRVNGDLPSASLGEAEVRRRIGAVLGAA